MRRTLALGALLSATSATALAHSSRAPSRADGAPQVIDAVTADGMRIRAHLERVEGELRERDTSALAPSARSARLRALDALHDYWQRGVFPRNTRHPGARVPYFIDDEGRACAMAHLIQASGAGALAEAVRARENNARIAEMSTELGPWLEENGLAAEEAARIQPDYCVCGDVYKPVCAEVHGDDGSVETKTFLNRCVASMCGGNYVIHEGECEPGDELAEPTCDGGVLCSGDSGCTCGLGPGLRGRFGTAPVFVLAVFGLFVIVHRRARRRTRQ